jgi:hypothetical protein
MPPASEQAAAKGKSKLAANNGGVHEPFWVTEMRSLSQRAGERK